MPRQHCYKNEPCPKNTAKQKSTAPKNTAKEKPDTKPKRSCGGNHHFMMGNLSLQVFLQEKDDVHPLLNLAETPCGGLSLYHPDWMHTKCLGTDAYLLGTCLACMAKKVLPGKAEDNVSYMWAIIREQYRLHKVGCRMSQLTLNMFKHEPFPRLSAKAMEIRCLLGPVAKVLEAWVSNPIVAWMHKLLVLSKGMDDLVFGTKSFKLSSADARALCQAIFAFNGTLTKLAWHFHQRGEAFCNYTIKNHYLCHIGLDVSRTCVSPRLSFCFQGEDFMSLVKVLCIASARGVDSAKLVNKVISKYLLGLDILLARGV